MKKKKNVEPLTEEDIRIFCSIVSKEEFLASLPLMPDKDGDMLSPNEVALMAKEWAKPPTQHQKFPLKAWLRS